MKKPRMYASLGGLGAIVLAFVYVPLDYHIISTLEIQALDAKTVYVTVPGKLEKVWVKPGDPVKKGDILAQLTSLDLELEIKDLEGQRDQYTKRLETLQRLQHEDSLASAQIPELEELLQSVEKQLAEQDAAMAGEKGANLWAVSATDGKRLGELRLDATPVWDGMAAADGKLYLTTTDGKVRCLQAK